MKGLLGDLGYVRVTTLVASGLQSIVLRSRALARVVGCL